ncbi:hypothetical protein FVE85_0207 [Porphyridium purpureum]|uniref:Secreted protein n=1 Tax=Porphyridium purpureum TaxID=35688 RepID=A0A5J4YZH2_PORPP|nr:hypothetical protein FVE85_0207 [Porphyridium purpureum]|eukprot:POR4061..scf208_2
MWVFLATTSAIWFLLKSRVQSCSSALSTSRMQKRKLLFDQASYLEVLQTSFANVRKSRRQTNKSIRCSTRDAGAIWCSSHAVETSGPSYIVALGIVSPSAWFSRLAISLEVRYRCEFMSNFLIQEEALDCKSAFVASSGTFAKRMQDGFHGIGYVLSFRCTTASCRICRQRIRKRVGTLSQTYACYLGHSAENTDRTPAALRSQLTGTSVCFSEPAAATTSHKDARNGVRAKVPRLKGKLAARIEPFGLQN